MKLQKRKSGGACRWGDVLSEYQGCAVLRGVLARLWTCILERSINRLHDSYVNNVSYLYSALQLYTVPLVVLRKPLLLNSRPGQGLDSFCDLSFRFPFFFVFVAAHVLCKLDLYFLCTRAFTAPVDLLKHTPPMTVRTRRTRVHITSVNETAQSRPNCVRKCAWFATLLESKLGLVKKKCLLASNLAAWTSHVKQSWNGLGCCSIFQTY